MNLEDPDRIPLPPSGISINIFSPEDEILTDEDSGKEDHVEMQKLPAAKLRAEAEFYISSNEQGDGYESEDNLPLSNFIIKNKIKSQDNFFLHGQMPMRQIIMTMTQQILQRCLISLLMMT
ncbi:hypothetical protein Zmor_013628 [Zophobas morio]|uniref:Uncharacterized protein n=1 Tax=Zophobas morio TaxID=2755281 RepID=A0AA38IFZ6_9CUCU|nr:hypothetical protein Zmor_013628 [Zophobas morio]